MADEQATIVTGLTLRDYVAIQMLQAFIANGADLPDDEYSYLPTTTDIVESAFKYADEFLRVRAR